MVYYSIKFKGKWMENLRTIKLELDALSDAIEEYSTSCLPKLSSKERLLYELNRAGFNQIGEIKYALDLRKDNHSWVSIILMFKGRSVDIAIDHLYLGEEKFIPASSEDKTYNMTSVRYSRVIKTITERLEELRQFYTIDKNT